MAYCVPVDDYATRPNGGITDTYCLPGNYTHYSSGRLSWGKLVGTYTNTGYAVEYGTVPSEESSLVGTGAITEYGMLVVMTGVPYCSPWASTETYYVIVSGDTVY